MRIVTIKLNDMAIGTIKLGFQGENEATQVVFDCTDVFAEYPNATPTLAVENPEGTKYPVTIEQDENNVLWTVRSSDTAYPGEGRMQLTFTDDTTVVKSYNPKTWIEPSTSSDDDPPDPIESWIEEVEGLLDDAEDATTAANNAAELANTKAGLANDAATAANAAATKIDDMEVAATDLAAGSTPTATITEVSGHKKITFGLVKGPKGDAGNGDMLATAFVEATANGAGKYVTYDGGLYYLPDGHTANTTWANTTKVGPINFGDQLSDVKSAIDHDLDYVVGKSNIIAETNWNTGAYISESGVITSYANAKYTDLIPVNSDFLTYFYKASTSSGTTRVHGYNSSGTWVAQITTASTGTTVTIKQISIFAKGYAYIRISESTTITPVALVETNSVYGELKPALSECQQMLKNGYSAVPVVANGSTSTSSGPTTGATNRIRTDLFYFKSGDIISIENGSMRHACTMWQNYVSSANLKRSDNSWMTSNETVIPDYDGCMVIVFSLSTDADISPSDFDGSIKKYVALMKTITEAIPFFKTDDIVFTSGYYYNITNHQLQTDSDYSYVKLNVSIFRGGKISGITSASPNSSYGIAFVDKADTFISGVASTNTGSYVFSYNLDIPQNAEWIYISCRNAGKTSTWINPSYTWDVVLGNIVGQTVDVSDMSNGYAEFKLKNARHVHTGANTPLTILHFSDLHGDTSALARIMEKASDYDDLIDEYICTGDMVANTYSQITSWWNENVLTCIGNHDTASYSGGSYNWTALSMANRDAYYIAPFESGWGITHTSGKSYYYKDYSTQKVRLIVMDGMLYTDNGQDATDQTAWLSGLLSSAITSNLHVLIAIHAPHGGATAEDCSFTEYGQNTMPTYSDCNTPQSVIDEVSTAIGNGLHFIGYIVGHTHHDVIWDAENNGKQIMYCVTCACVNNTAQWMNADMYRGADADAFNLITIDTSRTLVKIVRGGGADIDDHMRAREAICFNYSTGEKVGEVL